MGLLGGGGPILIPPSHAVMGLTVHLKGTHGQLHSTLRTPNPLYQPILMCRPHPHHMVCVCLYWHASKGVARLANHAHHLLYVCTQNDTIKEVREDIKVPL